MYARGQVDEFDDWNKVAGIRGWGWNDVKPYFLKHQGFVDTVPSTDQRPGDFSFSKENHGLAGPIITSFPTFRSSSERAYHEAAITAGIKIPRDAWSGSNQGIYANLATIDRDGPGTRSYAVTGYLVPNAQRPNLSVLTDALVEKIVFEKGARPAARGVVFSHGGKSYAVSSRAAVVLSAGAVMTPQLLELSGIGPSSVLSKLGIDTIVESPRVGDLEDHNFCGLTYDLIDAEFSLDHLNRPDIAAQALKTYMGGEGGPLANGVSNSGFLSLFDVADVEEREKVYAIINSHSAKLTDKFDRTRSDILLNRLKNPTASIYQIISLAVNIDFAGRHDMMTFLAPSATTTRFSTCVGLHHCFSRGSVHITSTDPTHPPAIDPKLLDHPVDELLLAFAVRAVDKILNTSPLKEKLKRRVQPPPEIDLNDIKSSISYVKSHTGTEFHPIATASLGLVVDERLNVLGVDGLKVADASVIPLHVSGNTQGPCYAIGEKAADLIKEDLNFALAR